MNEPLPHDLAAERTARRGNAGSPPSSPIDTPRPLCCGFCGHPVDPEMGGLGTPSQVFCSGWRCLIVGRHALRETERESDADGRMGNKP